MSWRACPTPRRRRRPSRRLRARTWRRRRPRSTRRRRGSATPWPAPPTRRPGRRPTSSPSPRRWRRTRRSPTRPGGGCVETRSTPARAVWDAAELVAEQLRALGGMFADRARDVQDVRDRIVAELLGLRAPGVPDPGDAVRAGRARPRPRRHRTARPRARPRDRHGRRRADGAHGDPRAVARHPVRRRGAPGRSTSPTARPCSSTARPATSCGTRRPSPSSAPRTLRPRPTRLEHPGRTADGHPVALLANVGDPAGAGRRGGRRGRGRRAVPHRVRLPRPDHPAEHRGAGGGLRAGVRGVPRPTRRDPHARRRRRQAAALRHGRGRAQPGARRPRAAHRRGRTRPVLDDQLAAIAQAAASSSADVWVMAPMVATADEADAFVERCAAPRAAARRDHGRGPRRRAAGRATCSTARGSRASAPTTSRSTRWRRTASSPGSRSCRRRGSRPCCRWSQLACAGGLARDRPGRGLRRGRGRPGARTRPGRARASRRCR